MIVAREDQQTPIAQLSFFDPAIEKYVTVRSNAIAVTAKGARLIQLPWLRQLPLLSRKRRQVRRPRSKQRRTLASNYAGVLYFVRLRSKFSYGQWCLGRSLVRGPALWAWAGMSATSSFAKEVRFSSQ